MSVYEVVARDSRDRLGEGPVWVPRLNAILWVDILAPAIRRLDLDSGLVRAIPVDEPVGWIVPRESDDRFIIGLKSGFASIDLETGATAAIGNPEPDRPGNRLNDAKVDRFGRIWAGSKDDDDREASGALYRLDTDYRWSRHDDGYQVTNGPTFSPDGSILYHTDSAARTVFAFDLAGDGSLSGKRIWLRFEDGWGYPDGMTTDAQGCLWIAHWGGGRVSRFAPDGTLIGSILLPASNITSCTFAGPDLTRMFVTSSTLGCEGEEMAGALFEIDPGVAGLAPTAFGG